MIDRKELTRCVGGAVGEELWGVDTARVRGSGGGELWGRGVEILDT